MTRLQRAIKDYQFPPFDMEMRYLSLMEEVLSSITKEYIECGNLDYRILAMLIKYTLLEAEDKTQIDRILWEKLHNQDIVIDLMRQLL